MFAIIDVEATGGDPKRDRLMDIAIFIHDGQKVIDQYSTLVNPTIPITNPYVIRLTGITTDMVENSPTFDEISEKIKSITEGCIIVGHNVKFDYSVLFNEFKWKGEAFSRKTLDTISLARRLLPGYTSYGLGKLCDEMGIPHDDRHRAFGDAAATTTLFDHLIKNFRDSVIQEAEEDGIKSGILPSYIDKELIASLPEDTGVYYLKNEEDKIIFIGKSTNIRHRVISHFNADMKGGKHRYLKNKIHSIDYILTGSELIALMLESTEIVALLPDYNMKEKKKKYKYGVYKKLDGAGYENLHIKQLTNEEPIAKFIQKKHASQSLHKLGEQFQLCSKKLGIDKSKGPCELNLHGVCKGACLGTVPTNEYNMKLNSAIQKQFLLYDNFLIFTDGKTPQEKGFIIIEDSKYLGYGYIDKDFMKENSPETLKSLIETKRDLHHAEIHRIIQSYLKKNAKRVRLVRY